MMIKRNLLISALLCGVLLTSTAVFADPIVELAAPRTSPKVIQEDGSPIESKKQEPAKSVGTPNLKEKKSTSKPVKKYIKKKKPVVIKIDYNKVSKMIEYGYYDYADRILDGAIARNSKDINALSLKTVSLAKQCKLDPAQNELDILLKKYPNNSNLHYAQGVVYYQRTTSSNMFYRNNAQKLIDNSLKEFKRAIELDGKNVRAYNAAGVVSIALNDYKSAKNYFEKALLIDKTYSMALDNLGTIDFTNGKYEAAEKKFKTALSYNTQNTTSMYHLAQVAMQKNDFTKALDYLNDALYINSNSPAIFNLMGRAYLAQGNEAAAINSFKKSLEVKPEFIISYSDLADIYEKRGDAEFAIEQLKTALAIDPQYYDAKLKIADISLGNGNFNQAINTYLELVSVDKYSQPALKGLASAYYAQAQSSSNKAYIGSNKNLLTALNCINKATEANPNDLELYLAKLKLLKLTNQPEQSKIALNKIVNSPNNSLLSCVTKGEAYLTLNDYANARKSFDSAINLSTNVQDDLYLSEIFIYYKQYENAEKVINKVLKDNPQNQEALANLDFIQKSRKVAYNYFKSAKFFLKTKNYPTATEYLSRSLSVDSNNAEAHLLLAELCEQQKDFSSALYNYKAYLGLSPNARNAKKIQKIISKLENKL